MQEYVNEKTVHVAVRVSKVSAEILCKGIKAFCDTIETKRTADKKPMGKQTVKELIGQNQGVSTMEVGGSDMRDFSRIARKYGVDYAIVKDKNAVPPKYTVFFKARDADALTQVLAEYTAKQMGRGAKEKPSILKTLRKFKEQIKNAPKKEHEKRKEQER